MMSNGKAGKEEMLLKLLVEFWCLQIEEGGNTLDLQAEHWAEGHKTNYFPGFLHCICSDKSF